MHILVSNECQVVPYHTKMIRFTSLPHFCLLRLVPLTTIHLLSSVVSGFSVTDFFVPSFALNSRPIAGHANLCPRSISTKLPELDVLISTVKHEILHALGFSVSLFAFYRDSKGLPLTPRDEHGKPALNEKYCFC